jgi:hypothetical protein
MNAPSLEMLLHVARGLLEASATETELAQVRQLIGAALDRCVVLDAIGRDMDTSMSTLGHPASVRLWLDGSLNAVDLARRLARGGLRIAETADGVCLVPREGGADAGRSKTRAKLFQAHAIIETARLALASKLETVDIETTVGDALQGALRIVDDVAAALEGVTDGDRT